MDDMARKCRNVPVVTETDMNPTPLQSAIAAIHQAEASDIDKQKIMALLKGYEARWM